GGQGGRDAGRDQRRVPPGVRRAPRPGLLVKRLCYFFSRNFPHLRANTSPPTIQAEVSMRFTIVLFLVAACGAETRPPAFAAACQRYIECIAGAQPTGLAAAAEELGERGACWRRGPSLAGECAAACQSGLE